MFDLKKLGLIACLNDNTAAAIVGNLQGLSPDLADHVLEAYLDGRQVTEGEEGNQALKRLNERPVARDVLDRTTDRIGHYLKNGIRAVTYWEPGYPGNLRLIQDPPLLLYVKGTVFPGSAPVALIGTRHPSPKGLELAYEFAARLASRGHTIVSGLGRGIDAQVHEGALGAGGNTIAVMGTPVTEIFPEENKELAAGIEVSGSLVSEITEEAHMSPGRFVQRSRIITGMSGSVVVIESARGSGIHRQVEVAIRQGRRVYAVDHGKFTDQDHGTSFVQLKALGAIPITHPDDAAPTGTKQLKLF
ncbi:MAG: DNA-protecting protein DprA [Methanomassiliicoccus sp.]|nr:DNA-protecting protein DprA [Methanomassiliicoccus sp.]